MRKNLFSLIAFLGEKFCWKWRVEENFLADHRKHPHPHWVWGSDAICLMAGVSLALGFQGLVGGTSFWRAQRRLLQTQLLIWNCAVVLGFLTFSVTCTSRLRAFRALEFVYLASQVPEFFPKLMDSLSL